jgi:hypothetical protein
MMVIRYALIRNNEIVKIRDTISTATLLISKFLAHDYRIITEQVIPKYDPTTQVLTSNYEILADKVMKNWIINERLFNEAKVEKKNDIEMKALSSIKEHFGAVDQNTKVIDILGVKDSAIASLNLAVTNEQLRLIKPVFPVKEGQIEP